MIKLIPFGQKFIAGNSVRTVSGRELHAFLGSKRQFADWIRERVSQYGFTEKADYLKVIHKIVKNSQGGRRQVEYHLTLDMAKELAMVERTDKGREARRYFIECEKELLERKAVALPVPAQPPRLSVDLTGVIPTRLLVSIEKGEIASTLDVSHCTVVDSNHLQALQINVGILSDQLRAVLGEGAKEALYKTLVEVG